MHKTELLYTTEKPLISFQVLSDVHIGSHDQSDENSQSLISGLKDIQHLDPDSSALITVGDNTNSGTPEQVWGFYHILDQYNPLTDEKTLIALGNHDVRGPGREVRWNADPTAYNAFWNDTAKPLYLKHNVRYMPKDAQNNTVYYDKWIDGYHFIVLNTENGVKDACTLSDEQLCWFEQKLAERSDDRPIFVFVHQPFDDSHWRSNILNGFGLEDKKVKQILKKYPQTIVMCGHIHNGLGITEAVIRDYGTTVEIPSYNEAENGYMEKGGGYHVMVYKDKIVFRARNFRTSTWLPEYDIAIKLPVPGFVYQSAKNLDLDSYTEDSRDEVEHLLREMEAVFDRKYDQEDLEWDDPTPAPVQLFSKETHNKADQISAALQKAVENPVTKS